MFLIVGGSSVDSNQFSIRYMAAYAVSHITTPSGFIRVLLWQCNYWGEPEITGFISGIFFWFTWDDPVNKEIPNST